MTRHAFKIKEDGETLELSFDDVALEPQDWNS